MAQGSQQFTQVCVLLQIQLVQHKGNACLNMCVRWVMRGSCSHHLQYHLLSANLGSLFLLACRAQNT